MRHLIDAILALSPDIRYAAIVSDGVLTSSTKEGRAGASSSESDRYEEWIVNPTLLKLVIQRGNIDCGGVDFVIVRYGNFYQLVAPRPGGHVSVCIEPHADPLALVEPIQRALLAPDSALRPSTS